MGKFIMEINSSRKYLIIFFSIALLLLIFFNLYSFEKYRGIRESRRQKFINQFQLQKNILEYRLEEMFASTYLERELIEKYLFNNSDHIINKNFSFKLKEEPKKEITTVFVNSGDESGNIVFANNSAGANLTELPEFDKLVQLLPLRHLLIKEEEFVEWSVYYTSDYFSIAPNIKSDRLEDPLAIFESVKKSLKAINNETKDLYQNGWETSVFKDHSGQHLLFSKNLPLKKDGDYIAILSSNISIRHLDNFIKKSPEFKIYITNSYNDLVYADSEKFNEVQKVSDYFPKKLLEKLKFEADTTFINHEEQNYISSSLAVGGWNLIYQLKVPLVDLSSFYFELIFSNLIIIMFLAVIFNLLRKNINLEAEKRKILLQEANYDELTGLYNKKKFFEQAEMIFKNAERENINFALAMFDLDDFKLVNDKYGHLAGDYVLQKSAEIIRENIRSSDLAARFGGEEFCLILTGVNKDEALNKIEKIRNKIAEERFEYKAQQIQVTISAGVTLKLKDSLRNMIIEADKLLYQSKKQGKNQTHITD